MAQEREVIYYKGRKITTYYDENPFSPQEWDDNDRFLVAWHRDFFIPRKGFMMTDFQDYEGGEFKGYHVFPVAIGIHSGMWLELGTRRDWDISNGWCYILVRNDRDLEQAKFEAKDLLAQWNDYLGGSVYGYYTDDDQCGGYYGEAGYKEMIDEACDNIDMAIKREKEAFFKRKKIEIKHRIPYDKRTVYSFIY